MSRALDLPDDPQSLKQLLEHTRAQLLIEQLRNEQLRYQIAVLKRARFGRSSEALDAEIEQMELTIEDLETSVAEIPPATRPAPIAAVTPIKPVRRPLPASLPRE